MQHLRYWSTIPVPHRDSRGRSHAHVLGYVLSTGAMDIICFFISPNSVGKVETPCEFQHQGIPWVQCKNRSGMHRDRVEGTLYNYRV